MPQHGLPAIKRLAAIRAAGVRLVRGIWRRWRHQQAMVCVTVVIASRRRRWRVRRHLRAGARQLQCAFGELPLIVVAQERLDGGRRSRCHTSYLRADGTPAAVIRLALTLDQQRLTIDELLAALVDEYVALPGPAPTAAGLEELFADLGAARDGVPRSWGV